MSKSSFDYAIKVLQHEQDEIKRESWKAIGGERRRKELLFELKRAIAILKDAGKEK